MTPSEIISDMQLAIREGWVFSTFHSPKDGHVVILSKQGVDSLQATGTTTLKAALAKVLEKWADL